MTNAQRWHIQFTNHSFPCFIAKVDTSELVYVNEALLTQLKLTTEVLGKPFYEVIHSKNKNWGHESLRWEDQQILEKEVFIEEYHLNFHCTSILIREGAYLFFELAPYENEGKQNKFEQAMTRCMEIYQSPSEDVLDLFMELLSNFYQCERAYVYRFNMNEQTMNGVARFDTTARHSVLEEEDNCENIGLLLRWIEKNQQGGFVFASKNDASSCADPNTLTLLEKFHIEDISLALVHDGNQQPIGFVGVSNREDSRRFFDTRLLSTIAHFVATDVSKEAFDATLFQLHHKDSLTGLSNRLGYGKREELLKSNPPKTIGVISINVNGLKQKNEDFGITGGDEYIKRCVSRLESHFGEDEFPYEFFRLSGAEFVALAPNVEKDAFETKVTALHQSMKDTDCYDFAMGSCWKSGGFRLSKVMREAEIGMYINKQDYYAFSKRHFEQVTDSTLAELLASLDKEEFMVYLQPQVRLIDGSLYGAEALIRRFNKETQKMVFPDQFIPLYEQKSVIRHVDLFVVNEVCTLLAKWDKIGVNMPISVNLSRVTLQEHGIVDTIVEICDRHQIPHKLLVIEVTERVGLIENNVANTLITAFKENGFNISLDDFGCAYSNIVTLAQIEVDEVKIDKSLVDDLTTSRKNHILVKNMLTMCNELDGASTLAEGIEDEQQARLLHQLGCHLGQGYFYSRPIPVPEFEEKYVFPKKST